MSDDVILIFGVLLALILWLGYIWHALSQLNPRQQKPRVSRHDQRKD
jgi:energy-converting hydrogenase Eha subunit F